ncbi:hypothetical protein TREES_T100020288 [Tupaia chinensis]|uniref:Uncharacterized protein n=1 Tax=Tupaia chinensis TaxID=246437 RepID=L9L519_TUPCH|nr:hypothetical protein TREES_T100020288 [Tupaia chinensis]
MKAGNVSEGLACRADHAADNIFLLCTNGSMSESGSHGDSSHVSRSLRIGRLLLLPMGQQPCEQVPENRPAASPPHGAAVTAFTWHRNCKRDVPNISMVSREQSVTHISVHDNKHSVPAELCNQHFGGNEVCFSLTDAFDVI